MQKSTSVKNEKPILILCETKYDYQGPFSFITSGCEAFFFHWDTYILDKQAGAKAGYLRVFSADDTRSMLLEDIAALPLELRGLAIKRLKVLKSLGAAFAEAGVVPTARYVKQRLMPKDGNFRYSSPPTIPAQAVPVLIELDFFKAVFGQTMCVSTLPGNKVQVLDFIDWNNFSETKKKASLKLLSQTPLSLQQRFLESSPQIQHWMLERQVESF